MHTSFEYTTVKRKNMDGVDCIAPFITMPNGVKYNLWDIPVAQYDETIENALKNAFNRGVLYTKMKVAESLEF